MTKTKLIEREKLSFEASDYSFGRYDRFTIADLTVRVNTFAVEKGVEAENVSIEFYCETSYYEGVESYVTFHGWRWETDEEFETRKARIEAQRTKDAESARKSKAAAKVRQEQKDLAEYERLKAKYEKGA